MPPPSAVKRRECVLASMTAEGPPIARLPLAFLDGFAATDLSSSVDVSIEEEPEI
jgi:hypothetical protein